MRDEENFIENGLSEDLTLAEIERKYILAAFEKKRKQHHAHRERTRHIAFQLSNASFAIMAFVKKENSPK